MLGFLGAWLFITLAPTSSFVPIVSEVGAERRMYLPLAAVVVLAVIGGRALFERHTGGARLQPGPGSPKGGHHRRYALATLVVVLVAAALAWGTARRNAEYASRVSILRTVVERWPHGRAHFNLAVALRMAGAGNSDEAVEHLRLAIPDNPEARYALGSELYDRGRFDEAIAELREFVRQNPKHLDVLASRNLIGLSLAQQGRLPEAAAELGSALKTAPQDPELHGNYAFVLMRQNDFAGAVRHYEESLKYRPNNAFALTNLGTAYSAMRQPDKALGYFRQAVAADPGSAAARVELVKALLGQRDFEGAVMHAMEAVRLTPGDPVVYNLAGVAYASQEKLPEAIEYFRQAVALNPNFVEARNNLAAAAAMTRAPK
jgi:tetratricopeptide (TPR) repeat protein